MEVILGSVEERRSKKKDGERHLIMFDLSVGTEIKLSQMTGEIVNENVKYKLNPITI